MVEVFAPLFDLDECNSEEERAFIEALHARAAAGGWSADAWRVWGDRLTLSVSPSDDDPEYNFILRTLRVDFDGATVRFGPDETHQFASDLDPGRADVSVITGRPVAELATAAANWLEQELGRPIVRQEWDGFDQRGVAPRRWVLADTGQAIVVRGQLLPNCKAPDRVVAVPEESGMRRSTASQDQSREKRPWWRFW